MSQIKLKIDFSPKVKKHMKIINETKNRRILRKNLKMFCALMNFDYEKYKAAIY